MKKIFTILILALLVVSCEDHLDVVFDTPFVSISDEYEKSSQMTISKDANNALTSLTVRVCVSDNYFKEPISIEYEMIIGDGLKEGVDFEVQPSTKSPLTFDPGTYTKPIRIIWMKNPEFDATKNDTLTVKLKSSSLDEMVIGYPGPDAVRSTFTFIKK